jgi:hypothetical protein
MKKCIFTHTYTHEDGTGTDVRFRCRSIASVGNVNEIASPTTTLG